jgi:hypothetical protein
MHWPSEKSLRNLEAGRGSSVETLSAEDVELALFYAEANQPWDGRDQFPNG